MPVRITANVPRRRGNAMRYVVLIVTVIVLWFAAMSAPPPQRYIWLVDQSNTGLFFEEVTKHMAEGPHKTMLATGRDVAAIKARRVTVSIGIELLYQALAALASPGAIWTPKPGSGFLC
jgi:hypothetical protein